MMEYLIVFGGASVSSLMLTSIPLTSAIGATPKLLHNTVRDDEGLTDDLNVWLPVPLQLPVNITGFPRYVALPDMVTIQKQKIMIRAGIPKDFFICPCPQFLTSRQFFGIG